jgi:hypothetical protein
MTGMRFLFLATLAVSAATAQIPSARVHDPNLHTWLVYAGDHQVAGRWGIHLEAQWRRHDAILRPQQLLLRPAVNYQVNPNIELSTGYGYVTTHRYGEYPVPAPFPEHRIYQQFALQHGAGGLQFLHRARTEQRWLGLAVAGSSSDRAWRYQNRFRYMIRLAIPLRAQGWYAAFSDEIMVNYAPRRELRVFDQNRIFAGVGRSVGRDTRVEAGYLQQTLLQRNARVLELNHTLQVAILSRLSFRRQN